MTIFDYLVLFVLICSVVISALNGLVKEGLSFAGWLAAFWVANTYSEPFAKMLPHLFSSETAMLVVAYLVLFVGVKLLAMLLEKMLQRMVEESGLSAVNRGLGALFGLGKGVLIVLAAAMLCGMTAIPKQPFWKNAMLRPAVETGVRIVKPMLPYSFAKRINF